MQVLDYLRSIDMGITSGSRFMWSCYGANAWFLDTEFASAVVDRKTGVVYELTHCSEENDLCHKWINPDYLGEYVQEAKLRKQDPWIAYDDVHYKQVDADTMLELIAADPRKT